MTNDFTVPPHSWFTSTNDYIDGIHNIFYQHWEVLDKERLASIEKIHKWRSDQKKQISKYADEQTVRVNENYNRLRLVFDEKHKENLETANAYYDAHQLDLFNELRDECQSLKFQVSTLEFYKYELEYPKVIILEEQVEKKNSEEINTSTRDEARRRRRLQKVISNNTGNSSGTTTSPPPNLVTTNSKQTNDQQLSNTKQKKKNDQSAANNDDESTNKCPICFMIFPLSMVSSDRQKHVNEHMVDDLDTNDI